jgi:hypothetical protein
MYWPEPSQPSLSCDAQATLKKNLANAVSNGLVSKLARVTSSSR